MFGYWDGYWDGLASGLPLFTILADKESWRFSQIWLLSSEFKHRLVSILNLGGPWQHGWRASQNGGFASKFHGNFHGENEDSPVEWGSLFSDKPIAKKGVELQSYCYLPRSRVVLAPFVSGDTFFFVFIAVCTVFRETKQVLQPVCWIVPSGNFYGAFPSTFDDRNAGRIAGEGEGHGLFDRENRWKSGWLFPLGSTVFHMLRNDGG